MTEGTGSTPIVAVNRCRGTAEHFVHPKPLRRHLGSIVIRLASACDLPAIHAFARAYMTDLPPAEIAACLADPASFPHDVILALEGREVVGVAQVARRVMHFGRARCKVGVVRWLRVVPELRATELPCQLLRRLEDHARTSGLHLGLSWTRWPRFFQLQDWVPVYRPPVTEIMVDPFLADLSAKGLLRSGRRRKRVNIRPIRRWDIEALAGFYARETCTDFGAFERSRTYWEWLLNRRGFDQLYVVTREDGGGGASASGPGSLEQPVLAYYVRRGWRIVEALVPSTSLTIAVEMLVHACREAKEQNRNWLLLDLPEGSTLRAVMKSAERAGKNATVFQGPVLVAKIWDLPELLRSLLPQFDSAAREKGEEGPLVLGLQVGARRLALFLDGECSYVIHCQLGAEFVRLSLKSFTQLILGQLDSAGLEELLRPGATASSAEAARLAKAILPPPSFWRSTLDDLPAIL
ncbi:MAG: hypothetical protein NZ899_00335 [Thermoguttaceae bacterium]|nr:hypothetical protein [Thermoguttaceae bacterium]